MPRASRAEEEIKKAFSNAKVTLTKGERGAFEVSLNGKLIFSKLAKERFPDSGELVKLINDHIDD